MAVVLKLGGGEPIELTAEELVIGREEDCDLTLADDEEVSRHHASIRLLDDGRAELRDLESRNGTFVDGQPITGAVRLSGGETIKIGQTEIATEPVRPPAAETRVSASPPPPAPTKAGTIPPPPPAEAETVAPPPSQEPPPTEAFPGPAPTEAVPTPPPPPPPPPPPAARQEAPRFDAPPPPPQPKKSGGRRWIWLAIGGAILLVLILAAIWFFLIRESDEDAINSTIEKFAAGDPEACELITDDLLAEQAPDASPDDAREQCKSEIESSDGSAEISNLQITGNRASATVTGVGGENDGQVEDAVLLKEDGEWKIDSFEAVPD